MVSLTQVMAGWLGTPQAAAAALGNALWSAAYYALIGGCVCSCVCGCVSVAAYFAFIGVCVWGGSENERERERMRERESWGQVPLLDPPHPPTTHTTVECRSIGHIHDPLPTI